MRENERRLGAFYFLSIVASLAAIAVLPDRAHPYALACGYWIGWFASLVFFSFIVH